MKIPHMHLYSLNFLKIISYTVKCYVRTMSTEQSLFWGKDTCFLVVDMNLLLFTNTLDCYSWSRNTWVKAQPHLKEVDKLSLFESTLNYAHKYEQAVLWVLIGCQYNHAMVAQVACYQFFLGLTLVLLPTSTDKISVNFEMQTVLSALTMRRLYFLS